MTKLEKRKRITLIVGSVLLFIVIYAFVMYLITPKKFRVADEELGIIHYCNPYFYVDVALGDKQNLNSLLSNSSICESNGYYSAIKSMTKGKDNITIEVYFLHKVGQNIYTLDNHLLGKFDKEEIKNKMSYGTVHKLTYQLRGQEYILTKLETG